MTVIYIFLIAVFPFLNSIKFKLFVEFFSCQDAIFDYNGRVTPVCSRMQPAGNGSGEPCREVKL